MNWPGPGCVCHPGPGRVPRPHGVTGVFLLSAYVLTPVHARARGKLPVSLRFFHPKFSWEIGDPATPRATEPSPHQPAHHLSTAASSRCLIFQLPHAPHTAAFKAHLPRAARPRLISSSSSPAATSQAIASTTIAARRRLLELGFFLPLSLSPDQEGAPWPWGDWRRPRRGGGAGASPAPSSWRRCSSSPPRSSSRARRGPRRCPPSTSTRSSPGCAAAARPGRRRPCRRCPCATSSCATAAGSGATTAGRRRRRDATRRSTCATASPSGSSRRGRTRCTTEDAGDGEALVSSCFLGHIGMQPGSSSVDVVLSCSCFPGALSWSSERTYNGGSMLTTSAWQQ